MKIQLSRFLQNRLGIVPASTKSSPAPVSVLANREPECERSSEELSHCSEKVISLFILPILLYSVLKRQKLQFDKDILDESKHFGENI